MRNSWAVWGVGALITVAIAAKAADSIRDTPQPRPADSATMAQSLTCCDASGRCVPADSGECDLWRAPPAPPTRPDFGKVFSLTRPLIRATAEDNARGKPLPGSSLGDEFAWFATHPDFALVAVGEVTSKRAYWMGEGGRWLMSECAMKVSETLTGPQPDGPLLFSVFGGHLDDVQIGYSHFPDCTPGEQRAVVLWHWEGTLLAVGGDDLMPHRSDDPDSAFVGLRALAQDLKARGDLQ